MVAISVAFVDFSYYFARVAYSNHIGWDVLDDYTVRTDEHVGVVNKREVKFTYIIT